MGYYINGIGTSFKEKLANLKKNHAAIETDSTFKDNLVCLIDNGPFAAAAYAYSSEERDAFANDASGRRMIWLLVPGAKELAN